MQNIQGLTKYTDHIPADLSFSRSDENYSAEFFPFFGLKKQEIILILTGQINLVPDFGNLSAQAGQNIYAEYPEHKIIFLEVSPRRGGARKQILKKSEKRK